MLVIDSSVGVKWFLVEPGESGSAQPKGVRNRCLLRYDRRGQGKRRVRQLGGGGGIRHDFFTQRPRLWSEALAMRRSILSQPPAQALGN
jgi:hypothetical protein